eukprot:5993137-Prymnesium_polylepis.1
MQVIAVSVRALRPVSVNSPVLQPPRPSPNYSNARASVRSCPVREHSPTRVRRAPGHISDPSEPARPRPMSIINIQVQTSSDSLKLLRRSARPTEKAGGSVLERRGGVDAGDWPPRWAKTSAGRTRGR